MMSSEYRIGMLSPDTPPHYGGMGRHIDVLTRALESSGVRIAVMEPKRHASPTLRAMRYAMQTFFGLSSFVGREGIDILHTHTGPGGAFILRPPVVPLIVTANHTYAAQSRLPGQFWKRIFVPAERATFHHADQIVCISKDTAHSVIDDYGIAPCKVSVIPCGIDLALWQASDSSTREPRTCLFVGRLDTRKGWDLLQRAWIRVRALIHDATLQVVGAEGESAHGIRFLGRLSDDDLRFCMSRARVLVAPSLLEGFGLAAAESIALGTPVVASDVPGLRCVVQDGVTGVLVAPTPETIADALVRILTDDALWRTLHHGCTATRFAFDSHAEADAYRRVYDSVYSSSRCLRR